MMTRSIRTAATVRVPMSVQRQRARPVEKAVPIPKTAPSARTRRGWRTWAAPARAMRAMRWSSAGGRERPRSGVVASRVAAASISAVLTVGRGFMAGLLRGGRGGAGRGAGP